MAGLWRWIGPSHCGVPAMVESWIRRGGYEPLLRCQRCDLVDIGERFDWPNEVPRRYFERHDEAWESSIRRVRHQRAG